MFLPPLCVSVEIGAPPAAMHSAAAMEESCDGALGKGICRIVDAADATSPLPNPCYSVTVAAAATERNAATVVLRNPGQRPGRSAHHSVTFRPHDAPADRWAALGLLIAALVTVEQYSSESSAVVPVAPPPPPTPPLPPPPEAPAEPPRVVMTPPRAPSSLSLDWDLRAAGLATLGQLPGLAWGLRIETTLGRSGIAGLARLSYLPARTHLIPSDMMAGGEFELLAPGAGVCWTGAPRRRIALRFCGGGDVYLIDARGFGVAEPAGLSTVSGAGWFGVSASLAVSRHAAMVAGLEGTAAILRPRFDFTGGSAIYTPPPVGGAATLGLAVMY